MMIDRFSSQREDRKAREGDLVETDEIILDVKGLVHPPNLTIAFIRYFPDKKGERKRNDTTYRKIYSLPKRYAMLKKSFPQYLVDDPVFDETLCEVPNSEIKCHHEPIKKLQEMRSSKDLSVPEHKALELATFLKEKARVSWDAIGVSGSILVGLHTVHSDIDLIVYSSGNCWRVRLVLQDFLSERDGPFKPYNREDLKSLFEFRSKDSAGNFESFVRTESRKTMQGKFMGTDFFVRFVKDWPEIDERYGDVQYRNVGLARIKAKISGDAESIFTPCTYSVEDVIVIEGIKGCPIREIASFRGRFCEQAKVGEVVVAQGKVEQVINKKSNREYFRLLLGNRPSDFMVLA